MATTIVTGVDGSATAALAAKTAAELAQGLQGELHVLSAYGKFESKTFASGDEQFVSSTQKDAEAVAAAAVEELRVQFPGLSITSAAAEGKAAEALVEAAERLGARVIVVGNKRVQGVARVLGSIARDVLTHAPCDVFVANTRGN